MNLSEGNESHEKQMRGSISTWVLSLLILGLMGFFCTGCLNADPPPYMDPYIDDAGELGCIMTEYDSQTWSGQGFSDQWAGTALSFVEFSLTGAVFGYQYAAAIGAPEAGPVLNPTGRVYLAPLDHGQGEFDPTSPVAQTIFPPSRTYYHRFGAAVVAADTRWGPTIGVAEGDEIIVGAPEGTKPQTQAGTVFIYHADAGNYGALGKAYVLGTTITPPTSIQGQPARFGESLAVGLDASGQAKYLAVGAPGVDRVYVYELDYTATNPPTLVQTLTAPPIAQGKEFGTALTFARFNIYTSVGYDLVVGAPEANAHDNYGRALAYKHISMAGSKPYPDPPSMLFGTAYVANTGSPDRFGAAMTAGNIYGSDPDREILMVGAPGYDGNAIYTSTDTGQICQYRLILNYAVPSNLEVFDHQCIDNPIVAPFDEFGASVAMGNFSALDESLSSSSVEAKNLEVAVGVPGFLGDRGRVLMLATFESGVKTILNAIFMAHQPIVLAEVYDLLGNQSGARFGETLVAGHAQSTSWEDILVGAPQRGPAFASAEGAVYLTKALGEADEVGQCHLDGIWETEDAVGDTVKIAINVNEQEDYMTVALTECAQFEVLDGDGNVCTLSLGGGVELSGDICEEDGFFEIPWDAGAGCFPAMFYAAPFTFSIVVEGYTLAMDSLMSYDPGTGELNLSYDPMTLPQVVKYLMAVNGCNVNDATFSPNPFVLTHVGGLPCE